jgi:formylglycine-generating enzyme required for sulfatase activity
MLVSHWDEAKGLVGHLLPQDSHRVLQGLALAMHQAGQSHITRDELEVHLEASLPPANGHDVSATTLIEEIHERGDLLVKTEEGSYAFAHLILQEYMAAKEIVDHQQKLELLLDNVGDRWWNEVATLYASIASPGPVVETLLSHDDDASCHRLLLAGRCVAESPSTNGQVRQQVIERLEDTLRTHTDGVFVSVGQLLAELASEDSIGFFLRLARDHLEMRGPSLWALSQMARNSSGLVGDRVVGQLLSCFRAGDLRQEAGDALERVCFGGDASVLEKCLSASLWGRLQATLPEIMDATMVSVPAGEFWMGDERQRTHVDAFQIGKYAVTNAQYKRFVDATGHPPPAHWSDRDVPPGKELHPVVFVSWFDAEAYANWAGKRLPSEQEWEKAARGTDGRNYPWGEWEEGHCNTREARFGDTTPVGSHSPQGDSPYGCAGMAGNVWEWTAPRLLTVNPAVRGGSWNYLSGTARCTYHIRHSPTSASVELGFRLADSSA